MTSGNYHAHGEADMTAFHSPLQRPATALFYAFCAMRAYRRHGCSTIDDHLRHHRVPSDLRAVCVVVA